MCALCVSIRMMTPLHVASEKGHGAIVELLTKHGARVNEADHLGQTPLHVAAQAGRVGVARFLLVNGADQNIRTTAGQDAEMVRRGGGEGDGRRRRMRDREERGEGKR